MNQTQRGMKSIVFCLRPLCQATGGWVKDDDLDGVFTVRTKTQQPAGRLRDLPAAFCPWKALREDSILSRHVSSNIAIRLGVLNGRKEVSHEKSKLGAAPHACESSNFALLMWF